MPHPIVHFEIPADDIERARKFYQDVFGWDIQPAEGGYNLITTGQEPGGGMMQRMAPEQGITVYIGVESADDAAKRAQDHGATIIVPKQAVPGMGYFVQLQDTEGNVFAIWEPSEAAT
jgi:predicted enzyme related to lactoylglutathione lyase